MREIADVIIFGGQSNMQGETERLSDSSAVADALEYKFLTDTMEPLCNPVGESIRNDMTKGYDVYKGCDAKEWLAQHVLGASCYGHTNMVPAFCKNYSAVTGRKVIAVHAAKGSTQIDYWLPGTVGFEAVVKKAEAAIKKTAEGFEQGHLSFVWLQGESDAIAGVKKAEYKEKMILLKDALEQRLGIETFGVIRVGRFTLDERDQEIIDAQDEVCTEEAGFIMLTQIATQINKIPEYMNPEVHGHYSAAGQKLLGETAGVKLGQVFAE